MSLEYFLGINTDLAVSDIYARIEGLLGNSIARINNEGKLPKIVAPGVVITAREKDKFGREIVEETYGLDVTVTVAFRLDKFEKYEQGATTAMRVSLELLRTTNSDGVIEFIDTPYVLRKNGILILEPDPTKWNHAPELAKEPYVLAPITRNRVA